MSELYGVPHRVSVYWTDPIKYREFTEWESEWYEVLYVVRKMKKILYVGMAYDQYAHFRLSNHHKLGKIVKEEGVNGLTITYGERVVEGGRRLSRTRIGEIENLLIYIYDPKHNERKIKTYKGRYLIVYNSGPGNPFDRVVTTKWVHEDDWIKVRC